MFKTFVSLLSPGLELNYILSFG